MEFKREVLKAQMETADIACDCCGRKDSDFRKNRPHDRLPMITLEGSWGYASKKDLEYHKAWICEECYDKIIAHFNIKPLVKEYCPFARKQSEEIYIDLSNEHMNGSIIDDPETGVTRYESEEWQAEQKNKDKSDPVDPVDKLRDWAKAFIAEVKDADYYSGPPPEGYAARDKARKIALELRELL